MLSNCDLVSNVSPLLIFCRYQMKCKSVSNVSPRYTNPPYVDAEDMSDLPNEYRHEPELGLASGTDGLKLTRRILGNAPDYLSDDGVLICEVGNSMVHLMEQYPDVPFTWLEFDNGGDGVFMLTKAQLLAAREHFNIYKD